jgi:hypothetical protein
VKEEGREEEGGMNEARLVEEMGNSLGVGEKYLPYTYETFA